MWINGQFVDKVCTYKYLATIANENSAYAQEIRLRIGRARTIFNKMKNALCSNDVGLQLKIGI